MGTINATDDMSTLLSCLEKAKKEGYTINFKVTKKGMSPEKGNTVYKPEDIKVNNFYRFEGASDPSESAILYLVETSDGSKGTITDAYGVYADPGITTFMQQVEEIEKKQKQ